MNKPLESERIEDDNTFEEKLNSTSSVENDVAEVPAACSNYMQEENEAFEEEAKEAVVFEKLTKQQIVDRVAVIVEEPISDQVKAEVESLKQAFYKLKRTENEEAKQAFHAEEGEDAEFVQPTDKIEERLKELLAFYREKRSLLTAAAEKEKEENLEVKRRILERLKELIESQDDFQKVYSEFRKLQQQWKEIKAVPQANVNELWKAYQHSCEKFYDLVKINNEMRDYDFRKNLELKTALCEAVERLEEQTDIVAAFHQVQQYNQEWKETGPVARELRDEIWDRFRKACGVINKKHQEHFEELRSLEARNLEEKNAICEEVEAIDFSTLTSMREWEEKAKSIIGLQDKWKAIGYAPRRSDAKVYERFRAACDKFFQSRNEFRKAQKLSLDTNYELKKALCEKAEALKDSQEWRSTAEKLSALQKEWKTIGPVPHKYMASIWKRFITACDYFFEQRNEALSSQNTEEAENLNLKREIIEKIKELDEEQDPSKAIAKLRGLITEWSQIGFVPIKEKDKIHTEYRALVDKHFDRLKVDKSERRLRSFKTNLSDLSSGEKSRNKLLTEREKLMRTYERLKNDIQTYENNIGFLSVSSKGGGGLVKEMNRKIENLREELDLIVKKIGAIDDSLGFDK